MTITKQQYVEYVISTPINYTCTNLAAHLEQVSHYAVNNYRAIPLAPVATHRLDKFFVTILKENRLVSLIKEQGYVHFQQIEWTPKQLQEGITVKLKKIPFKLQLFKLVATNGDIEWVITNRAPSSIHTQVVQEESQVLWCIEQLHRELKQLTGIERCQCRKQPAIPGLFALSK